MGRRNITLNEDFIKSRNEDNDIGYFIEADAQYPCKIALKNENSKIQKLVDNLHDKKEYVIDIKDLKEALIHALVLEKVHGVFKFNQKTWLKSHIDMNTELRKNGYNNFEKNAFKLINNTVFTKTMENVRKHRDIKLVTTEARRNYLVLE